MKVMYDYKRDSYFDENGNENFVGSYMQLANGNLRRARHFARLSLKSLVDCKGCINCDRQIGAVGAVNQTQFTYQPFNLADDNSVIISMVHKAEMAA